MFISRIQVEEGFLDGLDLSFSPGLNVLIGPRGVGKTSVIELIRFALDATSISDGVAQTARLHALSILGSGSVLVTLQDGATEFTIKRTKESVTASGPKPGINVTVLSQSEIESLGLHAIGRLRLIDSIRLPDLPNPPGSKETSILSLIRSQTEERKSLTNQIQGIRQQLQELQQAIIQGAALQQQHEEALAGIKKAEVQNQRLTKIGNWLACLSVRREYYTRLSELLSTRLSRLTQLCTELVIEDWPAQAGEPNPLGPIHHNLAASASAIQTSYQQLSAALTQVNNLTKTNDQDLLKWGEEARTLRRQLESLHQGAGEIARKRTAFQEKANQYQVLQSLERAKKQELEKLQSTRDGYIRELETIRKRRFDLRSKIIDELNAEFAPRIRIRIENAGCNSEYASAIVSALRGTGLRFNEVAPLIADRLSPSEFVSLIENGDSEQLALLTGIASPRAARIIERISEDGPESILTAPIEDGVDFDLLDGSEYKTTENLSTGQRCTVVLPLLLKQTAGPLVIDQPEDHLDNAFIVETLVRSIINRKSKAQLILSTHNANIPVLGEAEQVTLLGSDGARGFVRHTGHLQDHQTIDAITSIMEGGIEAFRRRATFYGVAEALPF